MISREFTACLTLQGQPHIPSGLLCRFDGDVHTLLLFRGDTADGHLPSQWAARYERRMQSGKTPDGCDMQHYAALSLREGENGCLHGEAHASGDSHVLLWTPTDGLCQPTRHFRVVCPFWVAVMDEESCRSLPSPRKLAEIVADACQSASSPLQAEEELERRLNAKGPVGIALYGVTSLSDDRLRRVPRHNPGWDALLHHPGGMC